MTAGPTLRIAGLRKSFGKTEVLRDVSFGVGSGEIVALIGQNGSGKTTCLRAITGLTQRDAGDITVAGIDPRHDPVAVRRRCSYLPGETSVYRSMTGAQFLHFACGFFAGEVKDLRQELADGFRLPLQRKVRTYSAGMKQQLALLAALLPDVDLYLLDEPDRALDVAKRSFLHDVLGRLAANGKAILITSHNLDEVRAVASQQAFLFGGRTVDPPQIEAIRNRLRSQVRVHLSTDTVLPAGATVVSTAADGSLLLHCEMEPAAWLAQIPADRILWAAFGATRLSDIYRGLLELDNGGGQGTSQR